MQRFGPQEEDRAIIRKTVVLSLVFLTILALLIFLLFNLQTPTPSGTSSSPSKTQASVASDAHTLYTKSRINVRAGPGTSYPILRKTSDGERLVYAHRQGRWIKLVSKSGQEEWVHQSTVLTPSQKRLRERSMLVLLEWDWRFLRGGAEAEGKVKNISGQTLRYVEVEVSFYDQDGRFITSNGRYVHHNPMMPGQVSAFKFRTPEHPAMKTARIDFTGGLMRERIPWYEAH